MIADDPAADNTDLYAFRSPDRPDTVTLVANYIPLEEPAGGPNFAKFDDSVLYELKVDNDGDADEDITLPVPLHDHGREREHVPLQHGPDHVARRPGPERPPDLHRHARGRERTARAVLGTGIADAAGQHRPALDAGLRRRSRRQRCKDLPGGIKVFAGQRDDPFFVDLGSVFDLAGLRPFNPFHLIPLPAGAGVDGVAGFNTHSIAIQVPIAQLVKIPNTTIGVYASAEPAEDRDPPSRTARTTRPGRGCRSRASATR